MTRETSIAAYHEMEANGLLSRLRLIVTKDIAYHGPTNQGEVTDRLVRLLGYREHSISPRFRELEDRKVIRVVGERIFDKTKVSGMVYELTGNMPVPPPDRLTKVEQEREECARLVEQRTDLKRDEIAAAIRARGSKGRSK